MRSFLLVLAVSASTFTQARADSAIVMNTSLHLDEMISLSIAAGTPTEHFFGWLPVDDGNKLDGSKINEFEARRLHQAMLDKILVDAKKLEDFEKFDFLFGGPMKTWEYDFDRQSFLICIPRSVDGDFGQIRSVLDSYLLSEPFVEFKYTTLGFYDSFSYRGTLGLNPCKTSVEDYSLNSVSFFLQTGEPVGAELTVKDLAVAERLADLFYRKENTASYEISCTMTKAKIKEAWPIPCEVNYLKFYGTYSDGSGEVFTLELVNGLWTLREDVGD
jgi:hypothetical protein